MNPSVAVSIAGHHHYSIAEMFILGYLLHAGLQIDSLARAKTNPITSRWVIVVQNGFRLAARFFVSLMAFLLLWRNPSAFPTILGYVGITLSASAIAVMTLPMSPPISGIMGFAVDSALAYVPMLKNALPPIELYSQVQTTVKETVSTETHVVATPDSQTKELNG